MRNDTIKVLIADADREDGLLIQTLLSRTRGTAYELQWLQDSEEAARALDGAEYDVCLLGDRAGEGGGLDLVRRARLARPNAPLILLTAREESPPDVDPLHPEVLDRLVKGRISAESLERAIRFAIERGRTEAAPPNRTAEHAALAAAFAGLSVGVFVTDPRQADNPVVFVNPAYTAVTGCPREDALGQALCFAPDVMQAIGEAVAAQRPYTGVPLERRRDGTPYRCSLSVSPVFDARGALRSFVGLCEDVTERHQALEAQLLSEQRFESMVANVPGMIYRARRRADGAVKFLYVSEGSRDLFGVSPEQLRADPHTLERLIRPEDGQGGEIPPTDGQGGERHGTPQRWRRRFVLPTGEEKVIQGMGHSEPQPDGAVIWDGLLMDVTERAQAEQKLAHLAAIVEGSHDAIKSKTLEGIVTSWNAAAARMYGYTADEMIGQSIARVMAPDRPTELTDLLKRIARGERVDRYETQRLTKSGALLDVELTLSPIRDSTGAIIGASTIAQDITERKRVEAALAAASAKNERIAETLQRSMLQEAPADRFPGLAVKTLYGAALHEADVGGDFFDAFALGGGRVALVVGDVSGKGLAAAGRTAEVKYALRAFLHSSPAPQDALAQLNDFLCETHRLNGDDAGTFIVLALAVVDTAGGEAVFSSAGAEPPLILRADGTAEPVRIEGMPLGIASGALYTALSLSLSPGETVLMATDGITEARRGGRFLGVDGLASLAERAGPTAPLPDLLQAVYGGARDFAGGPLRDDVCLLAARRQ